MLYRVAFLAAAFLSPVHGAFTLPARSAVVQRRASLLRLEADSALALTTSQQPDCGCTDVMQGNVVPTATSVLMNDVRVTGASLRSLEASDANGNRVLATSLIGEDGPAVIVFLRHLG